MQARKTESQLAVKRMKQFIAGNLHQPITASDVAKAAGYSQFHAARVFKAETGIAPFEFIRQQRLIASARALRSGKLKVLNVALDFVFDTHEGFTRAFTNGFGISPKKYATRPTPEGWLIPVSYLNRSNTNLEEWNMNKTSVIFTQIVNRPLRKLILKRGIAADNYHDYCLEIGCGNHDASAAWDVLTEIKEALYEPVGVWLPENMHPVGTGIYAHGVEVPEDYQGTIPAGFDVIELPACQMMVFQGEPYDDEIFEEAVGLCMEQIKRFNPEVYGFEWAPELAPRMQLAPEGWRGYIEMLPVRKATY